MQAVPVPELYGRVTELEEQIRVCIRSCQLWRWATYSLRRRDRQSFLTRESVTTGFFILCRTTSPSWSAPASSRPRLRRRGRRAAARSSPRRMLNGWMFHSVL